MFAILARPAAGADYLTDVKPLLEHKCYSCHGALKQQGGLRLDTAASLIQGGDSGSPIDRAQVETSLLLGVLTGDAGFQMPPANEGTPLSADEIRLIRDWIAAGAPHPKDEAPQADPRSWWSYRPIVRPPVPDVRDSAACRNDIDRFIAAARESRGLPVVPEADRATWLRRVYLDLIGLPPTRGELHCFLSDDAPGAFERVVDDLLSRPQYGERWGRHWMDVWRYSDWYGSRGGNEMRYSQRHIWRWRDWIIQSLNDDKGYDQMIREMLAADEIAGGDPAILPATGYLGRNWYLFDRDVWLFETVERTGEAFLGLTFRCARCHDHKFDPISQEEYYRFRAFFEPHNVRTDPVSALTGTQNDAKAGAVLNDGIALVFDKDPDAPTFRFDRGDSRFPDKTKPLAPGVPESLGGKLQIEPVELPPAAWYPMLRDGVRETLIEKASRQVDTTVAAFKHAEATARDASAALAAAEARQTNPSPDQPVVVIEDSFDTRNDELWNPLSGTWTWGEGKLTQSEVTNFATLVTKTNLPPDVDIHLRYRTLTPGTYRSVGFSFDYQDQGNSQDVYTSTGDARQSVQAFHRTGGQQVYPQAGIVPTQLKVGDETTFDVSITGPQLTINLNGERKLDYTMPVPRREGKFALWVHEGAVEFLELKITRRDATVESLRQKNRQAEQAVALAQAEVELATGELDSIRKRIAAEVARYLENAATATASIQRDALAAERLAAVQKAKRDLLKADGNPDQKTAAEAALRTAEEQLAKREGEGTYSPLGEQFPKTSTGRRSALAEWIASPENPRTARVAVNHIWGRHFGRPLVDTPENFGLNGQKPTHPELLDWLASELIAGNWTMKSLHRQIVLSNTYRLSAQPNLDLTAQTQAIATDPENRYFWRRNSRRMEAEAVRDVILSLAGRLDLMPGGPEIPETEGEKTLRRSVYFRNTPNEKMLLLEVFDVADPNACYRRKESIVPHQSLALMNSGLVLDSARALTELLAGETDFVTAAFETILNRPPTSVEANRCREFLSQHAAILNATDAETFSPGGTATRAPAADPLTRARENLVHVLLLHNDFVTIR